MPNKGILKQTQEKNNDSDNTILNNITLPTVGLSKIDILDGNNTTSKINTSNLQRLSRRVSFAPDVTLHSFDFVPEQKLKVREPRRRIPNELLPRSSQDVGSPEANNNLNMITSTQNVDADLDFTDPFESKNPDSLNDNDEADFNMEITELFVKENRNGSTAIGRELIADGISEETMDFTKIDSGIKSQGIPSDQNDPSKLSQGRVASSKEDNFTMEFTGVYGGHMVKSSQYTDSQPLASVSEPLEMTEIFTRNAVKIDDTGKAQDVDVNKSYSDGMDFTMIQPNVKDPSFTESKIPVASKRRKLNGDITNSLESNIPSVSDLNRTPSKDKDSEEITRMSDIEKMSPITTPFIENINDVEPKNIDNLNSGRLEKMDDNKTYSLNEFFLDLNMNFDEYDDSIENGVDPVIFNLINLQDIKGIPINQLYNSFYVDTPIIEMNTFVIAELLKKITHSKNVFDDLEKQIIDIPPPIISEYFSSDFTKKEMIKNKLTTIKNYSSLLAQQGWYKWRVQHLLGIHNVLQENITVLNDDLDRVTQDLETVKDIKSKTESVRASIRQKIKLLKELPASGIKNELPLKDKLNIENLKQELIKNGIKLGEYRVLKKRKEILLSDADNLNRKIQVIKNEISKLAENTMKSDVLTDYEIFRLKKKFSIIQKITNVNFVSMQDSFLEIKLNVNLFPIIGVQLSNNERSELKENIFLKGDNVDPFLNYHFKSLQDEVLNESNHQTILHILSGLLIKLGHSETFLKQYISFKLLYDTKLVDYDGSKYLQFTDYDLRKDVKIKFLVPVKEFINLGVNYMGRLNVRFETVRGQSMEKDIILSQFVNKTNRILPWVSEMKVNLLYV